MLKRIYIHNYRTFVNFEWSPPKACVLVGENGSGKSSLMDVLWVLREIVVRGRAASVAKPSTSRTVWLHEPEQVFEVELSGETESFRYRLNHRSDGKLSEINEELYAGGQLVYRSGGGKVELFRESSTSSYITIPFERSRSYIPHLEYSDGSHRIEDFRRLIGSIWSIRPTPSRFDQVSGQESLGLHRSLSNFVDWYRIKIGQDPEAVAEMLRDVRDAVTGLSQLRLEPISSEAKELRVRMSFGQKVHELRWSQLSEGQRLLIALYGMFRLSFSQASGYVLDEIENYVAPSEIQPFLRKLLDASAEADKQVIVISHHPESINYLAADSIWRMWRDPVGGHTRIAKVEADLDSGETAYDLVKRGEPDA